MNYNILTLAIPVFERYDFFEEAINSCLEQTAPVNIIVVDNNSSHTKFGDLVTKLKRTNVKYFRNSSNVGMVENWNRCIELCETEWISILHDDDWLHPQYAEAVLAQIYNKIDADCITVDCGIKTAKNDSFIKYCFENQPKYINKYTSYMMVSSFSFFPGVTFKVALAKKINGFDPAAYPIADYDFWVRISRETKVAQLSYLLAFYRISALQTTSSVSKLIIKTVYRYKKKKSKGENFITRFFSTYDTFWLYHFYKSFNFIKDINDMEDRELQKEYKLYRHLFDNALLQKVFSDLYTRYKRSLLSEVKYN